MLRLRGMLRIILTGIMTEISEGDFFFFFVASIQAVMIYQTGMLSYSAAVDNYFRC